MTSTKEHFIFDEKNTFCISMEMATIRWSKMERRFEEFGMKYTRHIASTPETLTDNFVSNLNGGQKSCSQSHVNVWRRMVTENIQYALILEDDACFDKDWRSKLDTFDFPENWNAIFLNCTDPIVPKFQWTLVENQYLTGGYILPLHSAKWLLNRFSDVWHSSDWMTTRMQSWYGGCYSFFPWLIIQEGNESTIGSGVEMDHEKVLRCLKDISYSIDNYNI